MDSVCLLHRRLIVDAKTVLTGFLAEPISQPELVHLLAEAGLELWQAPEGFWAIRVKPMAVPTPPAQPARRRRLEGQA
jgi:hypothetical protein